MSTRMAVKRLTSSDLTFFAWHFRNHPAGNQKAINLNADVFIKQIFPALPTEATRHGDRFPVDLDLLGPSGAPALNLQRKIVKGQAYKNWRLNGEVVENPADDPERFNGLREGDFVLFEFAGAPSPYAARAVLIGRDTEQDRLVHTHFEGFLGSKKMASVTEEELSAARAIPGLTTEHALFSLVSAAELEEVAQGEPSITRRLVRGRRRMTRAQVREGRERADEVGALGEEFVNDYLSNAAQVGDIESVEWTSRDDAIAPYDFLSGLNDGSAERIDVKATSGAFSTKLHVSGAELETMCETTVYRIYRLYGVTDEHASLRISQPLKAFAESLTKHVQRLPDGVLVDSFSISPTVIAFGEPIKLILDLAEPDDDGLPGDGQE